VDSGQLEVPATSPSTSSPRPGSLTAHLVALCRGYRVVLGASLLRRAAGVVAVDDAWSSAEDAGLRICGAAGT